MLTYKEYAEKLAARDKAVRLNASRRMRGLPALPLPEKPEHPLVPIAYSQDSNGEFSVYDGVLSDVDECPKGCVVRWEKALR